MVSFPTSLDSLANPTSSSYEDDVGLEHHTQHADVNDIAEALEAKLGIGASTPAANQVLRGTGAGASTWGAVQTAEIAASATSQRVTVTATALQTTTSTSLVDMAAGSVAITVVSGYVLILLAGTVSNNTAGQFTAVSVDRDGVSLGEHAVCTSNAGGDFVPFGYALTDAPAAGSRTYKLRWRVGGGTGTLNTGVLSVVELKR